MILEVFRMALVDSFLLARKFIPRWQITNNSDGVFWKYVTTCLPQLAQEYAGGKTTISQYRCEQVLIGKTKVETGKNAGGVIAKQQRCAYCIKTNRQKKIVEESTSSDSGTPRRARQTAYTCICHRDAFTCKEGVGGCWEAHLKECGVTTGAKADASDDDDNFGTDSD